MQQLLTGKMRFKEFRKSPERIKTKIGILPKDWQVRRVKQVFNRVQDRIIPKSEGEYQQIGIRSHGKGLFHKESVKGSTLGNKRVFNIIPNCFVINIVFAWELAIATTTEKEIGMIASHRFPMYKPENEILDLDFIHQFFKTKRGKELLNLASPGGAGRNKTLGQKEFENTFVPTPPLTEQIKIRNTLATIDKEINKIILKNKRFQSQKKGLMQQLLTGKKRIKIK